MLRLGAVKKGDRVLLIDDLIATGGTALAGFDLVDALGATVYEFAAMVALPFLNGVEKIHAHREGRYLPVVAFHFLPWYYGRNLGPPLAAGGFHIGFLNPFARSTMCGHTSHSCIMNVYYL